MHRDHDTFIQAIQDKRKVRVMYYDDPHRSILEPRSLIPLDYNPGRRLLDKSDCYDFWDPDSPKAKKSRLILESNQIHSMRLDSGSFDPSEFKKWSRKNWRRWFLKRNWSLPKGECDKIETAEESTQESR